MSDTLTTERVQELLKVAEARDNGLEFRITFTDKLCAELCRELLDRRQIGDCTWHQTR